MAFETMKDLTLEAMMQFIDEKAPDFKEDFKKVALVENKNGDIRYNSAKARYAFCEKFMPELLPKKKAPKKTKTDILNEW